MEFDVRELLSWEQNCYVPPYLPESTVRPGPVEGRSVHGSTGSPRTERENLTALLSGGEFRRRCVTSVNKYCSQNARSSTGSGRTEIISRMLDLLLAVVLDWLLGDPPSWPHPVKWMGTLIAKEEAFVRRVARSRCAMFFGGMIIVFCNLLLAFGLPFIFLRTLRRHPTMYHFLNVYLLYACLAARCLRDEAMKVAQAFAKGLEAARHQLSFIVGRDTAQLGEPEIVRATVETVAENTSDGVIAPLFYAMLGGAPLAMTYKMVNTMDSMLGYLNEKYRDLGCVPAKMDDVWNFIPARLTGVLMILSSLFRFDVKNGWRVMWRDRRNHKSPNCAYPESAVAGLLNVRLGGENIYFGERIWKPTIGDPAQPLKRTDIARAIEIMFRAEILGIALYVIWAW